LRDLERITDSGENNRMTGLRGSTSKPASQEAWTPAKGRRGRILRENLAGYTFILPALGIYALFLLYPLFNVIRSSLFDINTISQRATFVGLANFLELASDEVFRRGLANTVIYTVAIILLINVPAIIFAIIVDRERMRGGYVLRVLFFVPAILAPALIGAAFKRIFAPFGALNMLVTAVDLPGLKHNWLGDPTLAMGAVILTTVWQSAGWNMVIYYARLRELPRDIYESAAIDGASEVGLIRYIKVPLLKETIALMVVINIIGGFKVFDLIYIMTSGGPAHKTEVLTSFLYYQAFNFHRYGYASAVAVVMLALMLLFSWLRLRGSLAPSQ
jgi:raffinose/stachyose/melibiose transport system permease protein